MNIDVLNRIVELLRTSDLPYEADELQKLAAEYHSSSKDKKLEIANIIKDMCHPKWLGDFYIKDISLKEWYSLLDKLSKSV